MIDPNFWTSAHKKAEAVRRDFEREGPKYRAHMRMLARWRKKREREPPKRDCGKPRSLYD